MPIHPNHANSRAGRLHLWYGHRIEHGPIAPEEKNTLVAPGDDRVYKLGDILTQLEEQYTVGEFIRTHSGMCTQKAIWKELDIKMTFPRFLQIIETLMDSAMIDIDRTGRVVWICTPTLPADCHDGAMVR